MRGTATNFAELKVLDRLIRRDTTAPPSSWYLGVVETLGSDGDSLTELTDSSGYPRVAMSRATGTWTASSGGESRTDSDVEFAALPVALNGQTARYYVLFDAETGGNVWWYWRIDQNWTILAVSTGSKTFTIAGDQSAVLTNGTPIQVKGSTGNDGYYTITATNVSGGNTVVTVSETVSSSTADGSLYGPNPITLATGDVLAIPSGDLLIGWSGDISVLAANALNDFYLLGVSWPFSTSNRFLALFTAQSGDTVTEVSGNGYARCNVSSHYASAASGGQVANTVAHLFPKLTGSQGTAVAAGLYDGSGGTNLLARRSLADAIAIPEGKRVRLQVGTMIYTLN